MRIYKAIFLSRPTAASLRYLFSVQNALRIPSPLWAEGGDSRMRGLSKRNLSCPSGTLSHKWERGKAAGIILFLFSILIFSQTTFAKQPIVSQEFYINYQDAFKIHLKEKKISKVQNAPIVVLVNSLSIPSLQAFDVPAYSLMDVLAKNGFDVWGIDFVGEGKSSFPAEMQIEPAPTHLLPLQSSEALSQLEIAVQFILKTKKAKSINLLGWSWGSVVAAQYSIEHSKQVDHLILYGAMYSSLLPAPLKTIFLAPYADEMGDFKKNNPAYQNIPWAIIAKHWEMMREGNTQIVSEKALQAVANTYIKIDAKPFFTGTLRRPMGPMKDLFLIWNGHPLYDITKLTIPTLVIYGDQDYFADRVLFEQLTGVENKKELKLKAATHWLIYEKTRVQFNKAVIEFMHDE